MPTEVEEKFRQPNGGGDCVRSAEDAEGLIDRGRGPEIPGTRITVYRIMDSLQYTSDPAEIAAELEIVTERQVRTAIDYIHANQAKVDSHYRQILERTDRPNAAWLDQNRGLSRDQLRARIMERRTGKGDHDRPVGQ